eukprot:Opistho-1_new@79346
MIKAKKFDINDSNIALLGSDLEKKVKLEAANSEPAWKNAGKKVGLEIWRIEKFNVVSWPKEEYGKFFSGDSYIILRTFKKDPNSDKLSWDVHFWIGDESSQDEYGTAAYKTVELDDYLGGEPVQHREIQGHESDLFLSYFPKLQILKGGIESGFKKVKPEEYRPRLLQLKGKKTILVREVALERASLNSGDVFILDAGMKIYQWNGGKSSGKERQKGAELCRAIDDERKGIPTVHVMEEGDKDKEFEAFWKTLGGEGPVKSAEEGGSDDQPATSAKRLFRLSDASGKLEFTEVKPFTRKSLDTKDVFIYDAGFEVFVWIGKGASKQESQKGLGYASDYLFKNNRPKFLPISCIREGGENEVFESAF